MSNKNQVLQVGSKMYPFPRLPYETDEVYFARRLFLIQTKPKTENQYLESVRLSMIWANKHFLNNVYPKSIMDKLRKVEQTFS